MKIRPVLIYQKKLLPVSSWIVWDHYCGGKRWGDPDLVDHCAVCRYVGEWAIDLMWQKWRHSPFVSFGVFINNLINTDIYDFHMGKITNEKLKNVIFFLLR